MNNRNNYDSIEYGGFFIRVLAYLIDYILLIFITFPILRMVYGRAQLEELPIGGNEVEAFLHVRGPTDFLLRIIVPTVLVFIFWMQYDATPGKIAVGLRIVDASTGERPSTRQYVIRLFGQFLSFLCLFIGVIWVAFDPRKQAWHDKMANTVVIKKKLHK